MQHRAALLHPPVVSAPDDPAVMDEHRADRDPAFAPAEFSLGYRLIKKGRLRWSRHDSGTLLRSGGGKLTMLQMALVFLVIGLVAALLGFTTIAGASFAIAKFLAGLFLVLFLIFLILAISAGRRIVG